MNGWCDIARCKNPMTIMYNVIEDDPKELCDVCWEKFAEDKKKLWKKLKLKEAKKKPL